MIKKEVRLTRDAYYAKHLAIINPMLPISLTPKEIEVLASFMSLSGDIANDRFGTTARKLIMDKLSISISGLGNYLKSLKDKGFIKGNKILPILFPEEEIQDYRFRLINLTDSKPKS
jgi:DNA-binding CsgD family transcriptional regulator